MRKTPTGKSDPHTLTPEDLQDAFKLAPNAPGGPFLYVDPVNGPSELVCYFSNSAYPYWGPRIMDALAAQQKAKVLFDATVLARDQMLEIVRAFYGLGEFADQEKVQKYLDSLKALEVELVKMQPSVGTPLQLKFPHETREALGLPESFITVDRLDNLDLLFRQVIHEDESQGEK
jgi:hypothetical protein